MPNLILSHFAKSLLTGALALLSACGSNPAVPNPSPSEETTPYHQAKDYGYQDSGQICTMVAAMVYDANSETCVLANNGCELSYLQNLGFEAPPTGECEF